ncbi:MAG: hypothetical protein IJN29_06910 [Akkermansia sp.]|nr:hypothetical protein [Akkermansia sp.]
METHPIRLASALNIVFDVRNPAPGIMEYHLQIGNPGLLPENFCRKYCHRRRILRTLNRLCYLLNHSPLAADAICRMPCSGTEELLPRQPTREHWAALRRAGFLLFDEGRGEWSPADIYAERMQQGLEPEHMPTFRILPGGRSFCLSSTAEK